MIKQELLYVGVCGAVLAFEKSTGRKIWSTPLKSKSFVNVILDGDQLFAHTSGELFALDAVTGALLWQDGLSGYGYGMATLATGNSAINSQALAIERILEEQRQSSAATTGAA
jgi:outer membrane protein assembly factor BamB